MLSPQPSGVTPPRPAAPRAQFRPTAWHPSASAVCLGLGESNQELRLQFSGRAVRGASSLLFIHQQRRADPGLALSRRRSRPFSAPGSTLRRRGSPCSALTRGSAASSFACLPTFLPSTRTNRRPLGLRPSPARGRLRCRPPPLWEGCSGSQFPGTPRTNFWCLFLSPKCLSARSLISELSQCKGAGAGSQAGRETSFLLSCPGLCVGIIILVWLSLMSRSDLEKQPRGGPPGCVLLPSPPPPRLPVILPALPFGVASAPGRSPAPSLAFPPPFLYFLLHPATSDSGTVWLFPGWG